MLLHGLVSLGFVIHMGQINMGQLLISRILILQLLPQLILLLILLLIILFHVLYPFSHRSGGIALGCCPMIVCHVLPVLLIDKIFF